MPPETIAGRYAVERAIGQGGMGTVWLCRDTVLGRTVAVKEVGTMPSESRSDLKRALREARSAAALNHPNVVSVYDAVEDGDHNWLVMEYVPSRTLAQIITEDGPLPPARAAAIVAQAAEGLAAAHARGTVHRDVKPGNILVTDDDHAKIMDFGISRTHGDDQLTRSGLITGTPTYFSPEIARGHEPGPPSDVWALGATLYAAVEGHGPYPDPGNPIALLNTIASEPPTPPQRAGFLAAAIEQMMAREPDDRWPMDQAARELGRLGREAPAATTAATAVAAPPTPVQPAPAPAAAAAPAPAAAAADEEPTSAGRSRSRLLLPALALLLLIGAGVVGLVLMTSDGDQDPVAGDPTTSEPAEASPEESASSEPTQEAEPTEEAEPAEDPTTEEPSPTPSETEEGGDEATFATDYYSLLPTDTRAAYEQLSEDYRAGTSYGDYRGFWRTIESVEVTETDVVEEGSTVDVELTYTGTDGASEDETRRLYLEPTDDGGYVIVDDEIV